MATPKIEVEREEDGRWIAEAPAIPGAIAYGPTETEARSNPAALASRIIADRINNRKPLSATAIRKSKSP